MDPVESKVAAERVTLLNAITVLDGAMETFAGGINSLEYLVLAHFGDEFLEHIDELMERLDSVHQCTNVVRGLLGKNQKQAPQVRDKEERNGTNSELSTKAQEPQKE